MIDQRERFQDREEQLRTLLDSAKSSIWTSLPCIVESFDAARQTVTLRPAVKSVQRMQDGSQKIVSLPLLPDVPVHFPSGGGATLTFPIKKGDEALAMFASRSVDSWYQSGSEQQQLDARMHDLSDAFAIIGFRSKPRALSGVSETETQLRSEDGQHSVSLNPTTGITLKSGTLTLGLSPTGMTFNGNINITGGGTIMHNGKNIGSTHTHGGVTPGAGSTGAPN